MTTNLRSTVPDHAIGDGDAMRSRTVVRLWVATVSLALAVGCGTADPGSSTGSGAPAAEPAGAPALTAAPVGRMVPVGNAPEGIVIGSSGIAAVGVRDPDGVAFFDATSGALRQFTPTNGAPRHLSLGGADGPVIAALEDTDTVAELMLSDGSITTTATGVGRQPHDAARTEDGTVVVTNEFGGGVVFVRNGTVAATLPAGPPQPGGVAVVGRYAAVADVQGNGVWVYDGTTAQQVAQAQIGTKLTHAQALSGDVVAFADTDGGAVLLERITPQPLEIARIDADGRPYGMAFDANRQLLFVTLTSTNTLRVIDVADVTAPRILGDLPTVRQPNSVAVAPNTGTVLVTGSAPGPDSAVQIITTDQLPAR